MERETKTITTPNGHSVVLKSYLTGREANQIKEILFSSVKINMADLENGKPEMKELPANIVLEQEKKRIEILVVSLDGKSENITDNILDLPAIDYNFISTEASKIEKGLTPAK